MLDHDGDRGTRLVNGVKKREYNYLLISRHCKQSQRKLTFACSEPLFRGVHGRWSRNLHHYRFRQGRRSFQHLKHRLSFLSFPGAEKTFLHESLEDHEIEPMPETSVQLPSLPRLEGESFSFMEHWLSFFPFHRLGLPVNDQHLSLWAMEWVNKRG